MRNYRCVISRGGSTLGPGGHRPPPNVGQAPQIFWLQQQKYALLKSRLFLYSGKINTRINYCIRNDDTTDQNPNEGANKAVTPVAWIVRCLLTVVSVVTRQFGSVSIYLFMLIQNSLVSNVFSTPKTCYITHLLASLHSLTHSLLRLTSWGS